MFGDLVFRMASGEYANQILLIDEDHLESRTNYSEDFLQHGFQVIRYTNDLDFRIHHGEQLKDSNNKIVIVADPKQYIPYDMQKRLSAYAVSLARLFPRLNCEALRDMSRMDFDLICSASKEDYDKHPSVAETEFFIRTKVYGQANVQRYLVNEYAELKKKAEQCKDYREWFLIAETKARIDSMSVFYELELDTSEINLLFRDYMLEQYSKLSTQMNPDTPVLVSGAMEYMKDHSDRFVIIVMDGMSEFDWNILSSTFAGYRYRKTSAFAMIPTVTSVSRQCLLSGKYPRELMNPWTQSKEKLEFTECAKRLGYTDKQISYQRGYDAVFSSLVRCGAVIINDIDDMVHGQKQGRIGMYNDIGVMAKQRKLADLTGRLLSCGFDVYITADHGNTPRQGMGKLMGTGVETETKSRCMLVLKDFADKEGLKAKYNLLDFPKTYLPKDYDYLICDVGVSFDSKGEDVMSHGGISIDECVVPFIQVKAEENHG